MLRKPSKIHAFGTSETRMAEARGATLYGKRDFSRTKQNYEGDHVQSSTRTLLSSSCLHVHQKDSKFRQVCIKGIARRITSNTHWIQLHGTTVRFTHPTVETPKERKFCAAISQNHSVSTLNTPAQINFNSTVGHKCARPSIDHHLRRPTSRNTLSAAVFKNTRVEVFANSCSHNFQWPSGY